MKNEFLESSKIEIKILVVCWVILAGNVRIKMEIQVFKKFWKS